MMNVTIYRQQFNAEIVNKLRHGYYITAVRVIDYKKIK
jgi:hypothetical protein